MDANEAVKMIGDFERHVISLTVENNSSGGMKKGTQAKYAKARNLLFRGLTSWTDIHDEEHLGTKPTKGDREAMDDAAGL